MDHMRDISQVKGSFLFLDQTKENKLGGGEKKKRENKGRKKGNERKKKEQVIGSNHLFSIMSICFTLMHWFFKRSYRVTR